MDYDFLANWEPFAEDTDGATPSGVVADAPVGDPPADPVPPASVDVPPQPADAAPAPDTPDPLPVSDPAAASVMDKRLRDKDAYITKLAQQNKSLCGQLMSFGVDPDVLEHAAPEAPPVPAPPASALQFSDEEITRIAGEEGVDPAALRAAARLILPAADALVGRTLGDRFDGVQEYLDANKLGDRLTPTDVADVIKSRNISPTQWLRATPESQKAFLDEAVPLLVGRKVLAGGLEPVATPDPAPVAPAVTPSLASVSVQPTATPPPAAPQEYAAVVRHNMEDWGMSREIAEAAAKDYLRGQGVTVP